MYSRVQRGGIEYIYWNSLLYRCLDYIDGNYHLKKISRKWLENDVMISQIVDK